MAEQTVAREYDEKYVSFGSDYVEVRWREDLNLVGKAHEPLDLDHDTWWSVFEDVCSKHQSSKSIGWRERGADGKFGEYKWLTFNELFTEVERIASCLVKFGIKKGENIGLFSPNRPEWVIADFAMQRQSMVSVPLYATFGTASIVYILNHAEIGTVFCNAAVLGTIVANLQSLPYIKRVICFDNDGFTKPQKDAFGERSIETFTWKECAEIGEEHHVPASPPTNKDVYSIIYTSGTTGSPKGVVHTQQSVLAAIDVVTFYSLFEQGLVGGRLLCYLPLAHVYSRVLTMAYLRGGAQVGFPSGSVRTLFDDIAALKPTDMPVVPRVLKKMYDKIQDTVSGTGSLQKAVFSLALNAKLAAQENKTTTLIDWDSIAFKKTKMLMGGECRFILSASAPLDSQMVPFLSAVLCTPIHQAYGLTETFGGVCATSQLASLAFTSTGILLYGEIFRLVDVPEMGYFVTDNPPKGEIWIKGKSNFVRYYKNEEQTKETLTEDGWMKTGDIASLDLKTESFTIIDRKRNIFKMAQGEFISAEQVEANILRNGLFENIWVQVEMGDAFTVAVAVPKKDKLISIANGLGLHGEYEWLCRQPALVCRLLALTREEGAKEGCQSYELPQALFLEPVDFSEENNLLTPSLKLKRNELQKKYASVIKDLRKQGNTAMKAHELAVKNAAAKAATDKKRD